MRAGLWHWHSMSASWGKRLRDGIARKLNTCCASVEPPPPQRQQEATASSLMMLGPDELAQWLSRRRAELQAAQQAASLTSGGRPGAAPTVGGLGGGRSSVAGRQLTPHPRASAPPMTPDAGEDCSSDGDGDGDGEEEDDDDDEDEPLVSLRALSATVVGAALAGRFHRGRRRGGGHLRVGRRDGTAASDGGAASQLSDERKAKARLRQACVVCPECDQMVALCPQTKAITPHRCTPGQPAAVCQVSYIEKGHFEHGKQTVRDDTV